MSGFSTGFSSHQASSHQMKKPNKTLHPTARRSLGIDAELYCSPWMSFDVRQKNDMKNTTLAGSILSMICALFICLIGLFGMSQNYKIIGSIGFIFGGFFTLVYILYVVIESLAHIKIFRYCRSEGWILKEIDAKKSYWKVYWIDGSSLFSGKWSNKAKVMTDIKEERSRTRR